MNQKFSNILISLLIISVICLSGYVAYLRGNSDNKSQSDVSTTTPSTVVELNPTQNLEINNSFRTFTFDEFHGSKNISDKFTFQYPSDWYNEGQYWSSQKIEYYDLYSVKASFYFDLILSSIFDQTEFKNQINVSKRKSPDSHGKIDGKEFKRYDLID